MKKILKTLFDWSGRALQSQHLRTIVLLAFFVVGATSLGDWESRGISA